MSNISLLQKSFAANVNLWPNGQIFVQFDGFSKNIYILKKFKFPNKELEKVIEFIKICMRSLKSLESLPKNIKMLIKYVNYVESL